MQTKAELFVIWIVNGILLKCTGIGAKVSLKPFHIGNAMESMEMSDKRNLKQSVGSLFGITDDILIALRICRDENCALGRH